MRTAILATLSPCPPPLSVALPWRVFLRCPACIQPKFRLHLTTSFVFVSRCIPVSISIYIIYLAILQQIHGIPLYVTVSSSCIRTFIAVSYPAVKLKRKAQSTHHHIYNYIYVCVRLSLAGEPDARRRRHACCDCDCMAGGAYVLGSNIVCSV